MKSKIHPKYELTTISCACGNVIETRSTTQKIEVEICSQCHLFYTGLATDVIFPKNTDLDFPVV